MAELAIGVDLGGTNMRVALVTSEGEVLRTERERTPVKEGPQATADLMSHLIRKVADGHWVLGVGIGSPGPLSREKKTIFKTANLPGFENFPLGVEVEKQVGLKVMLDNDAKCATYGEGYFGAAQGLRNYILLTFGTGIGGGIIVDGKMIYGKSDGACEVGHITLHPNGEPCGCGNRGCFERYASATAIERRSIAHFGKAVSPRVALEELVLGNPHADALLKEVADDIALGCASLVNLFDPEALIFGGGVFTDGGGPLCAWVRERMKDRCFETSLSEMKIFPSKLAGNAGIMGAASLFFRGA